MSKKCIDRLSVSLVRSIGKAPAEIAQLVVETERAWQALGQVSSGATAAEKKSIVFRRSLYVVQDLKAGDVLTTDNVRAIRPGLGLPTKYLEQLLGMKVKQDPESVSRPPYTHNFFDFLVDIPIRFKFFLPRCPKIFKSLHACTRVHHFCVRGLFLGEPLRACTGFEEVLK